MSEKDYVTPSQGIIIQKDGSFDINKLYKNISMWYFRRDYDFTEKENSNKTGSSGSEVKLILQGERKVDSYVKFHTDMVIEAFKYKEGKGKLRINVYAYLELDYENKWENNALNKFLRHIYNKVIIKSKIKSYYEAKVYEETLELSKIIKSSIGLLA